RPLGCDRLRQSYDGFRKASGVVDVRRIGLRDKLHGLVACFHRTPVERRRDLEHSYFLRCLRVVAQREFASDSEPMLFWLDLDVQVVVSEGECFAVESNSRGAQQAEKTQG